MSANSRRHNKAHRLDGQARRKVREATRLRVGGPVLDRIEPGVLYRLREAIETRCSCGAVVKPGDYVIVQKFTSPNRVQVLYGPRLLFVPNQGSIHKIRASSLRARALRVEQP